MAATKQDFIEAMAYLIKVGEELHQVQRHGHGAFSLNTPNGEVQAAMDLVDRWASNFNLVILTVHGPCAALPSRGDGIVTDDEPGPAEDEGWSDVWD